MRTTGTVTWYGLRTSGVAALLGEKQQLLLFKTREDRILCYLQPNSFLEGTHVMPSRSPRLSHVQGEIFEASPWGPPKARDESMGAGGRAGTHESKAQEDDGEHPSLTLDSQVKHPGSPAGPD